MKADKIRGLDKAEVERQVQDTQEQLFRLRFQMGMGQMEGVKKYRLLKKDRARMLTVLSEKHTGPASAATVDVVKATAADQKKNGRKKK